MGEISILGFKKAQVFCIKSSSCVKTGKSLRAIETFPSIFLLIWDLIEATVWKQVRAWGRLKLSGGTTLIGSPVQVLSVKTGKSLRAIAEIWEWGLENAE